MNTCFKHRKTIANLLILLVIGTTFFLLPKKHTPTYPMRSIHSFTQAADVFATCTPQTLILFDIDDTLIASPEIFLDYIGYSLSFKLRLVWNYPTILLPSVRERIYSIIRQQAPVIFIEPAILPLIAQAQQKDCPVLGLTSMETGSYGVIDNMPEWRYQTLRNMGVIFTQTYPDHIFTDLPTYRTYHPVLYKGILCTNQRPKGEVLKSFLTQQKHLPTHIIFFDDSTQNLQSVGQACHELAIPVQLFYYTGSHKFIKQWNADNALEKMSKIVHDKEYTKA